MKKRIFIIILGLLLSFGFTTSINSLDVAAKKPKQDCTHKFKYTDYTDKKYKDGKTYTMNSLCVQHGSLNGNNALSFSDLHAKPDCYPSGLFSKPSNDAICTGVNKPGDRRFFLTVSLNKTKQTATVCLGTSYRTRKEWHAGMGGGSAPLDFPKVDSCVKNLGGRVFGTAEKNLDGLEKEIDAALGEYEKKQKKKGAQAMEGELTEEKAAAENGSNEAADKTCYDGAGALGWILCPVISHAENLLNGFYERLLEPMLKIDNVLISGSDGSNNQTKQHGTRDAWMVFRDIANYIFIAFFVVVIFSQLSGYGIDNYGIKKALPRLIMVAVLVNLSFILCQLAVDVSNIVGFSIKDLLDNIADGIMSNNKANGNISGFGHFLAISIIVAMFGVVAWISNFALILPIFLMAVSGIIALLFLCLMLGARLGAVLLLVAVSPIAIVCYALPNTKPLFDKWFKWLKTMLMLFPIVGLLMGGGQLASAILMASNNGQEFFLWFIAATAGLVPIFFIPTLTRNALSAFGSMAGRLTGLGSRFGSFSKARVAQSDAMQGFQQRAREIKLQRRAGIDKNGAETARGRFKTKFGQTKAGRLLGVDRGQYRAQKALAKIAESDAGKDYYLNNDGFQSEMEAIDFRQKEAIAKTQVENVASDPQAMQALLNEAISSQDGHLFTAAAAGLQDKKAYDLITESVLSMNGSELENQDFRKAVGGALVGLKPEAYMLGTYGKSLAKGSTMTLQSSLKDSGFRNTLKIGDDSAYVNNDDSAIVGMKKAVDVANSISGGEQIKTSDLISDTQGATLATNMTKEKMESAVLGSGLISADNGAGIAAALSSADGLRQNTANTLGYSNLASNSRIMNTINSDASTKVDPNVSAGINQAAAHRNTNRTYDQSGMAD